MKILLLGAGGREHALAWKLAQSDRIEKIYVAPGNGGTAKEAKCENVNPQDIVAFARDNADLTFVGPEQPLADGVVDALEAAGLPVFAPTRAAAQLETSKAYSKDFMARHNIPTARYANFRDLSAAQDYMRGLEYPFVIKESGLAAGKGVYLPENLAEAEAILPDLFPGEVVIEERLDGPEISVFAFCDGEDFRLMPTCQDHKRAHDGDLGPNTGGMGAYGPVPIADDALLQQIADEVIAPTLRGMVAEGTPYRGIIFAGMMLTADGPKTLEFNCRFGDPETQVLMQLLDSDLLDIFEAGCAGKLADVAITWRDGAAATVVLAAEGYPASYEKGHEIYGGPQAPVFHAGTTLRDDGTLVTNGGRVLAASARGNTLEDALDAAYVAARLVEFNGMWFRKDIGHRVRKDTTS